MLKAVIYWFVVFAAIGWVSCIGSTSLFRYSYDPTVSVMSTPGLQNAAVIEFMIAYGIVGILFGLIYRLIFEKK